MSSYRRAGLSDSLVLMNWPLDIVLSFQQTDFVINERWPDVDDHSVPDDGFLFQSDQEDVDVRQEVDELGVLVFEFLHLKFEFALGHFAKASSVSHLKKAFDVMFPL